MAIGDVHIADSDGMTALCRGGGPLRGYYATSNQCRDCLEIHEERRRAERPVGGDRAALRRPEARVVVSMTTIPSRAGNLDPTIHSLFAQFRLPDEIRLYVGENCDPDVSEIIHVRKVHDRGPVTKLSAVFDPEVPQDSIIVTVDDDITFHHEWLETLLHYAAEYPEEAVGMAGWDAQQLISSGKYVRPIGPCDVVEGFAGVAYRKWFFGPEVMDPPPSMKWVDDVWISSYLRKAGVGRRVVPGAATFVDHSRSELSGLHMRPEVHADNRAAAIAGFTDVAADALRARRAAALGSR